MDPSAQIQLLAAFTIGGAIVGAILWWLLYERAAAAERERKQALAQIGILEGLLPMCASCKRVRDDRIYWSLVHAYVSSGADAPPSRGLCPSCLMELYPEDPETHAYRPRSRQVGHLRLITTDA